MKRAKKIHSSEVIWDCYKEIAQQEIQILRDSVADVVHSPTQRLLDDNINRLSAAMYNTARTCMLERESCHASAENIVLPFRTLLDESDKALQRFLIGVAGAEDWHAARSLVVNENKRVHFRKIAEKWAKVMLNNDSKEVWNAINWKGESDADVTLNKKMPSSDDLAAHFLTKGDSHEPLDTSSIPDNQ